MPAEWIPTRSNTVSVAGFRVMYGGPKGGRLREHEHAEAQLEVHYCSQPATQQTTSELRPGETVIIPPRRPHVGDWENSSEVVVLLILRLLLKGRLMRSLSNRSLKFASRILATNP